LALTLTPTHTATLLYPQTSGLTVVPKVDGEPLQNLQAKAKAAPVVSPLRPRTPDIAAPTTAAADTASSEGIGRSMTEMWSILQASGQTSSHTVRPRHHKKVPDCLTSHSSVSSLKKFLAAFENLFHSYIVSCAYYGAARDACARNHALPRLTALFVLRPITPSKAA